jgi:hemolysin III
MRGWLHLFSFFGAIVAGAVLIRWASCSGPRRRLGDRLLRDHLRPVRHQRAVPPAPLVTARLEDHEAARPLDDLPVHRGDVHPVRLLAVDQPTGYWVLVGVWAGALAASPQAHLADRAAVGRRALYIGLGWVAVFILTDILHIAGVTSLGLLAVGGVLYTLGGVAYAIKSPTLARLSSATTRSSTR